MKVLQIGAGRWGLNHLRVWKNLGVDLYVADLSPSVKDICFSYGIPDDHFSFDYHDFIDSVSTVDIVTPAQTHYELVKEMIYRGKDIFVEKPFAEDSVKAQKLADLSSKSSIVLQVGHIFRYDPATDFIKDYISSGNLGNIQYMSGMFYGFKRPRFDGGVTISDAIHFIDLFNYILDAVPKRVIARCDDILKRGMDDLSWIWLNYNDVPAVIEANYFSPFKRRMVIINGEKETVVCDFTSSQDKIKIYKNRHILSENTWVAVSGETVHQEILPAEPLLIELKDFLRCVETRSKPRATAQDGVNAIKIVEAAIESYKKGMEITL